MCLIVGGTGMIGSALAEALSHSQREFWITGRSVIPASDRRAIRLDLNSCDGFRFPANPSVAFLCAARANIWECEQHARSSREVNVVGTLKLSRKLLAKGTFVVFLSTNAVFDGLTPLPEETSPSCATNEYGRQKAETERALLELDAGAGNVAIVRLTKVVSSGTGIARQFIDRLRHELPVEAFVDLILSPISLRYVINSLLTIERARTGGVFHLSGNAELSYVEFARRLAKELGVTEELVSASSIEEAQRPVIFRPRYPALGMKATTETFGIEPEPENAMVKNLLPHAVNTGMTVG
jgi:dTDP-4-dehydrorhamnose reductase